MHKLQPNSFNDWTTDKETLEMMFQDWLLIG